MLWEFVQKTARADLQALSASCNLNFRGYDARDSLLSATRMLVSKERDADAERNGARMIEGSV